VGNTSLFAGVFDDGELLRSFRLEPRELMSLPRRVGPAPDRVVLCSVVPELTPDVLRLVRRTWHEDAVVLTAREPHGLTIGYREPGALGTDRLAAALGARVVFPAQNVIVVDCGTATTITALHRAGTLLGGAILPGVSLWTEMLARRTAQLPRVTPRRPRLALGRSPGEAISSGVFFGHLGAIRECVHRVRREAFGRTAAVLVGTGGHAPLFANEGLFHSVEPELVLIGLNEFARRRYRER
jgi:type III pantothenate kinase